MKKKRLNRYSIVFQNLVEHRKEFLFLLYCTGITKGQLIIEAGIYGTVKENIAEQICSTGMGESKDGIAACSDALVTVLIETASMIQAEVSSTIKSYVPNDASPDGNKSMHALSTLSLLRQISH